MPVKTLRSRPPRMTDRSTSATRTASSAWPTTGTKSGITSNGSARYASSSQSRARTPRGNASSAASRPNQTQQIGQQAQRVTKFGTAWVGREERHDEQPVREQQPPGDANDQVH